MQNCFVKKKERKNGNARTKQCKQIAVITSLIQLYYGEISYFLHFFRFFFLLSIATFIELKRKKAAWWVILT